PRAADRSTVRAIDACGLPEGKETHGHDRSACTVLAARHAELARSAAAPHALPSSHDVRELRLALVCYGGVSLAIYMHGITKELEKLARASAQLIDGDQQHPLLGDRNEHAD